MIICLSIAKQDPRMQSRSWELRRFLISSLHYHYIENKIEYQIDDLNITICGASKRHLPLATHKMLPGNMIPNWLYLVINLPIIITS